MSDTKGQSKAKRRRRLRSRTKNYLWVKDRMLGKCDKLNWGAGPKTKNDR